MGSNVSIAEALAQLESKIAYHKEQEELHAAQEAHHAERQAFHAGQKASHQAEHRTAVERYEAFKAASESIGGMLVDVKPPAPAPAPLSDDIATGGWRWLSRLMSRVIETKGPDEVFGASTLIAEIHRRWGAKLKQGIEPRSVSATLRRWAATGRIHLVRDGRSYYESLYTRQRPADTH
ncbi:MAG: hypothetical protein ABUT39_24115 [Acidobacteriota bacterium]